MGAIGHTDLVVAGVVVGAEEADCVVGATSHTAAEMAAARLLMQGTFGDSSACLSALPLPWPISILPLMPASLSTNGVTGPTRDELKALAESLAASGAPSGGVKEWIDGQMALPLTSHREYFRRRVAPRMVQGSHMLPGNIR